MFGLLGDDDLGDDLDGLDDYDDGDGLGYLGAANPYAAAVKALKKQYKKGKQVKAGKKININFKQAQQVNATSDLANNLVPITLTTKGKNTKGTMTAPADLFYTGYVAVASGAAYAVVVYLSATTGGTTLPNYAACPAGYTQNIYGQCSPVQNQIVSCPVGQTQDIYGRCVTGGTGGSVINQQQYVSQGQTVNISLSTAQIIQSPASGYQYLPITVTQGPTFGSVAITMSGYLTGRVLQYGGAYYAELQASNQGVAPMGGAQYVSQGQQVTIPTTNVVQTASAGYQYLPGQMYGGSFIFTATFGCYTTGRLLYQNGVYYAEVQPTGAGALPSYMYQMQQYPAGTYYSQPETAMPYQYATPQYAQQQQQYYGNVQYGAAFQDQYAATPSYASAYGAQAVFDDTGILADQGFSDEMGLPADYVQYQPGEMSIPTIDQAGSGVEGEVEMAAGNELMGV